MKNLFLLAGLAFIITNGIKAQHCPWDAAMILVVAPGSEQNSAIIPGLEITLLDSLGQPLMQQWWEDGWKKRQAFLWQNPSETTNEDIWHTNYPCFHFWFAQDNYVLVCNVDDLQNLMQLKIRDQDEESNGGYFRTMLIEVDKEDFYPLCTNFSLWDKGEAYGFVDGFKPVRIVLSNQ